MLYGVLAITLTAIALTVCFPAVNGKSVVTADKDGARETVEQFFFVLKKGDYDAAEERLSERTELDGQMGSEQTVHARVLEALRESWNCRLLGDCVTEKTSAWQEIQLQVLDFSRMEPAARMPGEAAGTDAHHGQKPDFRRSRRLSAGSGRDSL